MRPVTVILSNPNDSIRLVYNRQYTAATLFLDGNYKDVDDHYYSSTIRLRPMGSAVLIKMPSSSVIPYQTPVSDSGVRLVLYPNPTTGILHWQLTDSSTGNIRMRIVDARGKTIGDALLLKSQPLLESQIDMTGRSRGIYFLQLWRANGSKSVRSFVKQ